MARHPCRHRRLDNLLVAPPHPRNPLIADAFKRTGIVERTGRGINRIFEEQLRFGHNPPGYGRTTDSSVVAVLPGSPVDLALTPYVLEQDSAGHPLRLSDLQVVTELFHEPRLGVAQVAGLLQTSDSETRHLL